MGHLAPFFTDFLFAWPWMWLALPLPLLMRLWPLPHRPVAALRVPWRAEQLKGAISASHKSLWRLARYIWLWLIWLLLCAAAARPQHLGPLLEPPPQQARQMMLALDLSGSMDEIDMRLGRQMVDRLTAAKAVLADFLQRREGDHIGLLVFGERAYTLTPITRDLTSVREQLRDSVVGLPGRATAIGDAIGLAVKRLREQPEGERVLILLTDGDNNAGVLEPLKAAELAATANVRVHTIAFGGDESMNFFGRRQGRYRHSIDEATLVEIAHRTGGVFFRARDTAELIGIYAELDRIEPIATEGVALRPRIERYPWPLLMAVLLALPLLLWPPQRL